MSVWWPKCQSITFTYTIRSVIVCDSHVCVRLHTSEGQTCASRLREQRHHAVTPVLVYPAYLYDNLRNAVTIATAESLALAPCEDQNQRERTWQCTQIRTDDKSRLKRAEKFIRRSGVHIASQVEISESEIAPLFQRSINSRAEATVTISGFILCVLACIYSRLGKEWHICARTLSGVSERYDSASFHNCTRQKREFIHLPYAQPNYL